MFERSSLFNYRRHLLTKGYGRQWQRLWRRLGVWRDLLVFETSVGVKYKNSRFHSDFFGRYLPEKLDFLSANLTWADLLLPPDLLKNPFTNCGKTVLASPHYELMAELGRGAVPLAYMERVRAGTLDGRPAGLTSAAFLRQQYQNRLEEVARSETVSVWVTPVRWRDERKYMIVDGKHRAALAAQLNRPELLTLQVITSGFSKDPFFESIYSYVLKLDSRDYSINQEMIQAIRDES